MTPKLIAERYEIKSRLGRGGMGSVYLAEDLRLLRDVAIKVMIDEEGWEDSRYYFQREARAAAALQHPSIVQTFDYSGPEERPAYIVMEVVKGATLKEVINERAPIPERVILAIIHELAAGLTHAHEAGVMHRDVKPNNVLVDPNGRVALTDFGLAKAYRDPTQLGKTVSGRATAVLGTAGFMAPEQILDGHAGPESDVFALGCVAYALASGSSPFADADRVESLRRIAEVEYVALRQRCPQVSPELEALVERCLAWDASARARATELEELARALLHGRGHPDARTCVREFMATAPRDDDAVGDPDDAFDDDPRAPTVRVEPTPSTAPTVPLAEHVRHAPTVRDPPRPELRLPAPPRRRRAPIGIAVGVTVVGLAVGVSLPWLLKSALAPTAGGEGSTETVAPSAPAGEPVAAPGGTSEAATAASGGEATAIADPAASAERPMTPALPATGDSAVNADPDASREPNATAAPHGNADPNAATEPNAGEEPAGPQPAAKESRRVNRTRPARHPREPVKPVKVNLIVKPWGQVFLDGKEIGNAPLVRYLEAPPGRHEVMVTHPRGTQKKTVQFGKHKQVEFDFTSSRGGKR